MKRLFVRVYFSVVLAIAATMIGFTSLVTGGRLAADSGVFEQLLEQRLRPLVRRLDALSPTERRATLAREMTRIGPVMALVPIDLLELDAAARADLGRGEIVVVGNPFGRSAYVALADGTTVLEVMVLGHETMRIQWLWLLGDAFMPVALPAAEVSPADRARAEQRPVALAIDGETRLVTLDDDGRLRALAAPIPLHERGGIAPLLAFLLTGVALALVLVPVQRKLRRLSEVTERIAQGDLDARVGLSGGDEIAELGRRFDAMASRVAALVRSKQELLDAVAHELRGPIGRLVYASDLLRRPEDGRETLSRLDDIDASLTELRELTDELLTSARLDGGVVPLHLEAHEANDLLEAVVAGVGDARVSLELRECPLYVRVDERLWRRALTNLTQNALCACASTVTLFAERTLAGVCFRVVDDGPGVAVADREHIFEPFVRLEESRSRDRGGVGLGLAIVRKIARQHGGEVTVSDAATGGACFSLELPASTPDPATRPDAGRSARDGA